MIGRADGTNNLTLTYNYDNKPELIQKNGINHVQFTYDGYGQRVKKYNYSTGQSVIYFGELYEVRAGLGTIHIFAGNKRVASVFSDGRTQFYHVNHLGSASVITDQNGDRKERIEYFPFGTYREVVDYDTNFPDVFYTFTGQEDDDDLGLYNFKARSYDPLLGKFISPDSLVPKPNDPQSFNRYSYCLNNPLKLIDPTGRAGDAFHFGTTYELAVNEGISEDLAYIMALSCQSVDSGKTNPFPFVGDQSYHFNTGDPANKGTILDSRAIHTIESFNEADYNIQEGNIETAAEAFGKGLHSGVQDMPTHSPYEYTVIPGFFYAHLFTPADDPDINLEGHQTAYEWTQEMMHAWTKAVENGKSITKAYADLVNSNQQQSTFNQTQSNPISPSSSSDSYSDLGYALYGWETGNYY